MLIHVVGHTMLGYGYNTTDDIIYIRNTWDHSEHQMTWGGSYSGMQHKMVSVIELVSQPAETEPPLVSTGDAGNVTQTSASLVGSLEDLGTADLVEVSFEWDTTSGSYTHEVAAGVMETTGLFDAHLAELLPGTTYYYRAVAAGDGTSYGTELQFTTLEEVPQNHH